MSYLWWLYHVLSPGLPILDILKATSDRHLLTPPRMLKDPRLAVDLRDGPGSSLCIWYMHKPIQLEIFYHIIYIYNHVYVSIYQKNQNLLPNLSPQDFACKHQLLAGFKQLSIHHSFKWCLLKRKGDIQGPWTYNESMICRVCHPKYPVSLPRPRCNLIVSTSSSHGVWNVSGKL